MKRLLTLLVLCACTSPATLPLDGGELDSGMTPDAPMDTSAVDAPPGLDGSMDGALPDAGTDAPPTDDGGPPSGFPEARVEGATYQGRRRDGVDSFLGIRYAESPAGSARFRAPIAHTPSGTIDAAAFGPGCPRLAESGSLGDEDCLMLNVWRPSDAADLPVMVFLPGGAFVQGTATDDTYDGASLASRDVVIVTVDYRIGMLGWLSSEALASEDADGMAGNYGLRDQMMALDWVQQRIEAFGGDPNNVTVFGESAGAMSVCALLATPSAEGLFHRAIVQSPVGCHFPDRAQSDATGNDLMRAARCDDLACLRTQSVDLLLQAANEVRGGLMGGPRLRPVEDGRLLERRRLSTPEGLRVPLLVGSNADEGERFASRSGIRTAADYEAYLVEQYGARASDVGALYPTPTGPVGGRTVLSQLWTDVGMRCPALDLARTHASTGMTTYAYEFRYGLRGGPSLHAIELLWLFDTLPMAPGADDEAVTELMQRGWTEFAERGEISVAPEFDAALPERWLIQPSTSSDSASTDVARCDALVALGVDLGA